MEDDLGVLARLLDASGNYLSPTAWRHRSGFQPVPALAPGQAIVLAVQLVDEAVSDLPAGEYGVLATLVSLNLQSKPGLLRLT
jgi:hypothetical protein